MTALSILYLIAIHVVQSKADVKQTLCACAKREGFIYRLLFSMLCFICLHIWFVYCFMLLQGRR